MREISNCLACKANEIVDGMITDKFGTIRELRFDPVHKKWYKFMLQPGVPARSYAKCCTVCGLVWTNLNIEDLKKYISTKCDDKLASSIYKPRNIENSWKADCMNCGSKRKITGKLFRGQYPHSAAFMPNHLITYKFFNLRYTKLTEYSDCCTNCGFITTRLNPKKLNKVLWKNCKPEYLKQIYSCNDTLKK